MRRRRIHEAIKRILFRESLNQPLMVIFEDLHWIDAETQALLNLLVDSIATARMLLLVNYRPEYQHQWGSRTYYTQLRLDPLGKEKPPKRNAGLQLLEMTGEQLPRIQTGAPSSSWRYSPFFMEERGAIGCSGEGRQRCRNGAVELADIARELRILHLPCRRFWRHASTVCRRPGRNCCSRWR